MPNNQLNYEELIKKYPWIVEKGHNCILSPDADGMICGLFMSHYLDWNIVGYYDNGKYLLLKNDLSAKDCIFLDTEIYRKDIRSCGHHINLYQEDQLPPNWDNYFNCLNPNHIRSVAFRNNLNKSQIGKKYPLATIHLLLCIVEKVIKIDIPEEALYAILQPDGTINRFIDQYTENLLDWLKYLGAFNADNIIYKLLNRNVKLLELSIKYVDYVNNYVKQRKDKIPISDTKTGDLISQSFNPGVTAFSSECERQIIEYLQFISKSTGWTLNRRSWAMSGFRKYEFTKKRENPGKRNYQKAARNKFLSLAITSTNPKSMEYTLEKPDRLP